MGRKNENKEESSSAQSSGTGRVGRGARTQRGKPVPVPGEGGEAEPSPLLGEGISLFFPPLFFFLRSDLEFCSCSWQPATAGGNSSLRLPVGIPVPAERGWRGPSCAKRGRSIAGALRGQAGPQKEPCPPHSPAPHQVWPQSTSSPRNTFKISLHCTAPARKKPQVLGAPVWCSWSRWTQGGDPTPTPLPVYRAQRAVTKGGSFPTAWGQCQRQRGAGKQLQRDQPFVCITSRAQLEGSSSPVRLGSGPYPQRTPPAASSLVAIPALGGFPTWETCSLRSESYRKSSRCWEKK